MTSAILIFGIAFRLLQVYLDRLFSEAVRMLGQRWLCFGLTIILGLLAGFITAVVAALVFAEALSLLRLIELRRLPRRCSDALRSGSAGA